MSQYYPAKGRLTRRSVMLAGLATGAFFLTGRRETGASPVMRVAALDWGLAESLTALGITPVALPEIHNYRQLVDPYLPETVLDLGLRIEPNFEVIERSKPDLIIVNPGYVDFAERLERVAPVKSFAVFDGNGSPFDNSSKVLTEIAAATGREAQANICKEEARSVLDGLAEAARTSQGKPVYLVTVVDERHVMVHGNNSLFQHPLNVAGLRNGWDRPGNLWGYSNIGFEGLTGEAEAWVINLGPIPTRVQQGLDTSRLWNSLPFVREGRFHTIPSLWIFGGLPSAMRFTTALTEIIRITDQ